MAFSSVLHDLLGLLSRQQMMTTSQVKKTRRNKCVASAACTLEQFREGPLKNNNVYMDFFLSRTTNILNRRPLFTLTQVRRPGIWKEITFLLPQ